MDSSPGPRLRPRLALVPLLLMAAGAAPAEVPNCIAPITGALTLSAAAFNSNCIVASTGTVTQPSGVLNVNAAVFTNFGQTKLFGRWQNGIGGIPKVGQDYEFVNDGTSASLLIQNSGDFDLFQNIGYYAKLVNRNGGGVAVNGHGSLLYNGDLATVLNTGSGSRFTVSNGATLVDRSGYLTNDNGALLEITGAGSALVHESLISLAYGATVRELTNSNNATLRVSNGGLLLLGSERDQAGNALFQGSRAYNQSGAQITIAGRDHLYDADLRIADGSTLTNTGSGSLISVGAFGSLSNMGIGSSLVTKAGAKISVGESGGTDSASLRNLDGASMTLSGTGSRLDVITHGTVENSGGSTLTISNRALFAIAGGQLTNSASFHNSGGQVSIIVGIQALPPGDYSVTNTGSMFNESGGYWLMAARGSYLQSDSHSWLTNQGVDTVFEVAANAVLEFDGSGAGYEGMGLVNDDSASFTNNGTLTLATDGAVLRNLASFVNGGTLTLSGASLRNGVSAGDPATFVNQGGGLLTGGDVNGNVFNFGTFTNAARIENVDIRNWGTLRSTGSISGTGTLVNFGTLMVADGGDVSVHEIAPGAFGAASDMSIVGGTLLHGNWQFETSAGVTARLRILAGGGSNDAPLIDTIGKDATVGFSGTGTAEFSQLTDGLRAVRGTLQIGPDYTFTPLHDLSTGADGVIDVEGTLKIAAGHTVQHAGMLSLGGELDVAGTFAGAGAVASHGLLRVEAGGRADVHLAGFTGGTLDSGRWEILGDGAEATLALHDADGATPLIDTIGKNAAVTLSGRDAHFDQLTASLAHLVGTLGIGPGYAFATSRAFVNDGRIENQGEFTAGANQRFSGGGLLVNDASGHVIVDGLFTSRLENHGLVSVSAGGLADVTGGDSFDPVSRTLTSGTWEVSSDGRAVGVLRFAAPVNHLGPQAALFLHGRDAKTPGDALHLNEGWLAVDGGLNYTPGGAFDNRGTLVVGRGGAATIANSLNFGALNGRNTLRGGEWDVVGGPTTDPADRAVLTIAGGAPIEALDVDTGVTLRGVGSSFDQFERYVRDIKGGLAVADGRVFTPGQAILNEGTIAALEGGTVALHGAVNFRSGVLDGGAWYVDAGAGKAALTFEGGKAAIRGLAAGTRVSILGAGASFDELTGALTANAGSLGIGNGFKWTIDRDFTNSGALAVWDGGTLAIGAALSSGPTARFSNSGELDVTAGGRVTFTQLDNLASGVLSGGTWNIVAGKGAASIALASREGIARIDAGTSVLISGKDAHFDALESSLTRIDGTLAIEGRSYAPTQAILNRGTLRVGPGGDVTLVPVTSGPDANLVDGVLQGGRWEVVAGAGTASLTIQGKGVSTLGANTSVLLSGERSLFDQLDAGLAVNEGTLEVADGRVFTLRDGFENRGTLVARSGGSFTSKGMLDVSTGTLTVDGVFTAGQTNLGGGTLGGSGTLHGKVTVNGGTIAPGHSPGLLTFTDSLVVNTGTLEIQIGGTARGTEYDAVDGTDVVLGGTLDVSLYDLGGGLFQPHAGDYFDIVGADHLSGDFTTFVFEGPAGGWSWSHRIVTEGNRQFYRLGVLPPGGGTTPVPLPPAWLLLGSAAALLRRRR